jgi:hypothetical protein
VLLHELHIERLRRSGCRATSFAMTVAALQEWEQSRAHLEKGRRRDSDHDLITQRTNLRRCSTKCRSIFVCTVMSDEPFYTPGKKPPGPKYYRPVSSERLWELRKDHITWSCPLRFHGESY